MQKTSERNKPYEPQITREKRSEEKINSIKTKLSAWKAENKLINPSFYIDSRVIKQDIVEDKVDFIFYNVWGKGTAHLAMPQDSEEAKTYIEEIKKIHFMPGIIAIKRKEKNISEILLGASNKKEKEDIEIYEEIKSKENCEVLEFIYGFEKKNGVKYKNLADIRFRFTHKGKSALCFWGKGSRVSFLISKSVDTKNEDCVEDIADIANFAKYSNARGIDKNHDFEYTNFYMCFDGETPQPEDLIDFCESLNIEVERRIITAPKIIVLGIDTDPTNKVEFDFRRENLNKKIFSSKYRSEILKGYWQGMLDSSSPALLFLNAYRIIEYVSIEEKVNVAGEAFKSLIANVNSTKAHYDISDLRKFEKFLKEINKTNDSELRMVVFKKYVKAAVLHEFLESNKKIFSKPTPFDGENAFTVPALYSQDFKEWEKSTQEPSFEKICFYIDRIRNSLAHGGEKREQDQVITFTKSNMKKLYPYAQLAKYIAEFFVFLED